MINDTFAVWSVPTTGRQLDTAAEVRPLHHQRQHASDEGVVGFQVTVQDATGMQLSHTTGQLKADIQDVR